MRKLTNILVALDGSSSGFHALEESIRLSQWARATVSAITVAPLYEGDLSLVGVKNIKDAISGPGEEILGEAMEIAESYGAQIKVIWEEGEIHEKIADRAETERSDIIVLGAASRCSPARAFLGSVASRLIEISRKDVLVIPESAVIGWENILLAADGSDFGRSSIALAVELAASYGSELKVVLQDKTTRNGLHEEVRTLTKLAGIGCEVLVKRSLAHGMISDLAGEQGATLIILGCQATKGLKSLITGSLPERLIRSSRCPILVVRAHHDQSTPGSNLWS